MKFKKLGVSLLSALMLYSGIPVSSFATSYSDVPSSHWAYQFVQQMNDIGIMVGFGDGTFGPAKNLTFPQIMTIAAKIQEPDIGKDAALLESVKKELQFKYGDNMAEIEKITKQASWVEPYLYLCLTRNIIDLSTVKAVNNTRLTRPLSRVDTVVIIAKALGLEQKANEKSSVVLPFADASSIPAARQKYLEVLLDINVLSPEGKGNKMFKPGDSITRAEMSVILSKANDYKNLSMKTPPPTPTPTPDIKKETAKGSIYRIDTASGNGTLTVQLASGNVVDYYLSEKTVLKLNDKSITFLSLETGMEVELTYNAANNQLLELVATENAKQFSGRILGVEDDGKRLYFEYTNGGAPIRERFDFDSKSLININGKPGNVSEITLGLDAKITVKNRTILSIDVTKPIGISAVLLEFNSNTGSVLVKAQEGGREVEKRYTLNRDTQIFIDGRIASSWDLQQLRPGTNFVISEKNGTLSRIDIVRELKLVGTVIEARTIGSITENRELKIKTKEDKIYTLRTDSVLTQVLFDRYRPQSNERVLLSDIKPGDAVELTAEFDTIRIIKATFVKTAIRGKIISFTERIKENLQITIHNHTTQREESYFLADTVLLRADKDSAPKPYSGREIPLKPGFDVDLDIQNELVVAVDIVARSNYSSFEGDLSGISEPANAQSFFRFRLDRSTSEYYEVIADPNIIVEYLRSGERTTVKALFDKIRPTGYPNISASKLKVTVFGELDGKTVKAIRILIHE